MCFDEIYVCLLKIRVTGMEKLYILAHRLEL